MPQVIRLCRYVRVPFRRRAPWSRRGVLVRDRHRCAYCGRRATTVDHVVPRSRGGGDTWLNTVASCAEDNHRKADRTPEQAGMPLLTQPFEPTPADAMLLALGRRERRGAAGVAGAAGVRGAGGRPCLRAGAGPSVRAAARPASSEDELDDGGDADHHDQGAQRGGGSRRPTRAPICAADGGARRR